jgi:hypothetical protein
MSARDFSGIDLIAQRAYRQRRRQQRKPKRHAAKPGALRVTLL